MGETKVYRGEREHPLLMMDWADHHGEMKILSQRHQVTRSLLYAARLYRGAWALTASSTFNFPCVCVCPKGAIMRAATNCQARGALLTSFGRYIVYSSIFSHASLIYIHMNALCIYICRHLFTCAIHAYDQRSLYTATVYNPYVRKLLSLPSIQKALFTWVHIRNIYNFHWPTSPTYSSSSSM